MSDFKETISMTNRTTPTKGGIVAALGAFLASWLELDATEAAALTGALVALVTAVLPVVLDKHGKAWEIARRLGLPVSVVALMLVAGCTTTTRTTYYDEAGAVTSTEVSKDCRFYVCPDDQVSQMRELSGVSMTVGLGPLALGFHGGGGSSNQIPKDADAEIMSGATLATDPVTGEKVAAGFDRKVSLGQYDRDFTGTAE